MQAFKPKPHIYRVAMPNINLPRASWYAVWAAGRRDKRGPAIKRSTFREICLAARTLQIPRD